MSTPKTLWMKSIFATDHRSVGISYLFTGFAFLFFGGLLAMLMRWQLGFPGHTLPWVGLVLRQGMPEGRMLPDFYHQLFTIHGTVMIFFAVVPILMNGFGNYLVPTMIGAQESAFSRLNRFGYWTYLAAGLLLLSSFFLGSGAAKSGWFAYPPLSAVESTGQTFWILSLMLLGIGSIASSIAMLTTILNARAPGMHLLRMPLFVWNLFIANCVLLLAYPSLLVAITLLLCDRLGGTSFFLPAGLHINSIALQREGGQPLLWQHLFWFFGHPEVYLVIMPAMGIVSEVLPVFARKPIFGYRGMVISSSAIGGLGFLVWGHHMFVSGMNPVLGTTFMVSTSVIAVPSAIKMFNWLSTLYKGSIHFQPPMLCALAFLSLFVIGGLSGIFLAMTPVDVYLHNTSFVVGHFHFMMVGGALFGLLAGLYYWFPLFTGRMLNAKLGAAHIIPSFILFVCLFYPMFVLGLAGEPRRLFNPEVYPQLIQLQPVRAFMSVCAFLLFTTQALFLFNVIWSWRRGRPASQNPWTANTLEWSAEKTLRVYRGPYEYSVADRTADWHAQTDPEER